MVMDSARQAILDHSMIPSGTRVLVAVSGGLDSVVLLDVLHRLSSNLAFDVAVGHIDHGLRGTASIRDAAFVRILAENYALTAVHRSLTESDLDRHRSLGREGAARHARLAALEELAAEAGAGRIALGHTLEDHAETIIDRLARGTGPTGMIGIPAVRGPFVRPLLRTSRSDILAYAIERALTWREDATNADLTYARNRIRHRILPELHALHPGVVEALARTADLLADLDEAVAFLVDEKVAQLRIESDDSCCTLNRRQLASLPDPVLRLVLREQLRRARGHLEGIEFAHIEAVRRLVTGRRARGELSLPGIHVRMQGGVLACADKPLPSAPPWEVAVRLGETRLPHDDWVLELKVVPVPEIDLESIRSDRWIEAADADCVTFPMVLRTRRPGDRFAPLGLEREIKLKDFLINERTPVFDRDRIPLLCDSRAIVWVAGIRLSDTVRLSDQTRRVLLMRMKGAR